MSESCAGENLLLFTHSSRDVVALLEHYHQSKAEQPTQTTAVFILPQLFRAPWHPSIKGMKHLTTCQATELFDHWDPRIPNKQLSVYYDAPRVHSGCYAIHDLPEQVQALHTTSTSNGLTFVFDAKVAGLPSTVLWDSGAINSFISSAFVQQHNLTVSAQSVSVGLANGTTAQTQGLVAVKVKVQQYQTTVSLHVIDLTPGIDVILGDDWSQANGVVASYEYDPDKNKQSPNYVAPSLAIRSKRKTIFPLHSTRWVDPGPSYHPKILSAVRAAKLLAAPRFGSNRPFLVVVKESTQNSAADRTAKVQTILDSFADVFESPALTECVSTLGDITPECIPIEPGKAPVNRPPFRLSQKERLEVEAQVQEALEKGWITLSSSSYGAPVLFVPKPDGTLRMCIDYRALNNITVKNKYPMPRIDDLLDNISGAKYFSSIDLASGYHQLRLQESDCPKTAFNTHIGKYEWRVMPFGLTNAPAVFQSAMNQLFHKHLNKCVSVYLDDILIFSKTEEEHLQHLASVLQVLRDNNLKAKLKKCDFFKPALKYLGHIVSSEGLYPDPAKVQVVTEWPVPQSVYDVRSFLGLANYFRKYIKGYAAITAPLTDLLKGLDKQERKGRSNRWARLSPSEAERLKASFAVRWTPAHQTAFMQLKEALTSAPVLTLPDFSKPFELVADACQHPPAVGAVLLQEGRPVAYYSRKLSGSELNYSPSDIEMLAVISALSEWRCYLEGPSFTIVTDHQPNTYLDVATNAHTIKRRARWLSISCGYTYKWCYRPGRLNVADPISRAPQHFLHLCSMTRLHHTVRTWRRHEEFPQNSLLGCVINDIASSSKLGQGSGCASCCHMCCAVTRTRSGVSPTSQRDAVGSVGSPLFRGGSDTPFRCTAETESAPNEDALVWDQFFIENFTQRMLSGYAQDVHVSVTLKHSMKLKRTKEGLLWTNDDRLVVPDYDNLRYECFESVHKHPYSGHYGVNRTVRKANLLYYWPNMERNIGQWIQYCDSCQKVKAVRQKPQGLLQPLQIPNRRWESVSMDFITKLPTTPRGNDSIWVVVDRLSKMVHVEAIKEAISAEEVAYLYHDRVFRYHGVPQDIVSDRDVRFRSLFWRSLAERLGTKLSKSTKDHPQSDGQTERMNGVLEDTLRHFVGPYQTDWDERLAVAEFAMNSAFNASVQATPFMLNYGQTPDDPTIAALRSKNPAVNKFVGQWDKQLVHAKKCLKAAQDRMKVYADKHRRPAPEYKPGDQVLLRTKCFKLQSQLCKKLAPRYVGPFKVIKAIEPHKLAYKIELPPHLARMHPVFHVSALKEYKFFEGNYTPPPLPDIIDGEMEYEVDWIEKTRYSGRRRQYLVHWLGYDNPTWEPFECLTNCPQKLHEFWKWKGSPCPHSLSAS